jgi:hypothetical protein
MAESTYYTSVLLAPHSKKVRGIICRATAAPLRRAAGR